MVIAGVHEQKFKALPRSYGWSEVEVDEWDNKWLDDIGKELSFRPFKKLAPLLWKE